MQPAVALVIALSLIEYGVAVALTGLKRLHYNIPAPQITGNPEFERCFRVQQNSLEQLVVFVPAMLLFGEYVNGGWIAFALGALFLLGRAIYMRDYLRDPQTRRPGFLIGCAASAILVLGGLLGSALALLRSG